VAPLLRGPTFTSHGVDRYDHIGFASTYTNSTPISGAAHANANANTDIGRQFTAGLWGVGLVARRRAPKR
jgi:hypothetical protein